MIIWSMRLNKSERRNSIGCIIIIIIKESQTLVLTAVKGEVVTCNKILYKDSLVNKTMGFQSPLSGWRFSLVALPVIHRGLIFHT